MAKVNIKSEKPPTLWGFSEDDSLRLMPFAAIDSPLFHFCWEKVEELSDGTLGIYPSVSYHNPTGRRALQNIYRTSEESLKKSQKVIESLRIS